MRPRGLRSPWRKATPTYWFEPDQPSRMVERSRAITEDVAAQAEALVPRRGALVDSIAPDAVADIDAAPRMWGMFGLPAGGNWEGGTTDTLGRHWSHTPNVGWEQVVSRLGVEPRQTTSGPGDRAAEGGEGQEVAVTLPLSSSSA